VGISGEFRDARFVVSIVSPATAPTRRRSSELAEQRRRSFSRQFQLLKRIVSIGSAIRGGRCRNNPPPPQAAMAIIT
jgi:hypothetical protein